MRAVQRALPLSFGGLVIGLPLFFLLATGSFTQRLSQALLPALGVMAVALLAILAVQLARELRLPWPVLVAASALAFVSALPSPIVPRAVGASGLFLALVLDLTIAGAMVLGRRMGRLGTLGGAVVVVLAAFALRASGVVLAAVLLAAIHPLGDLGDSWAALIAITAIESLLWTFGIHGPALLAAVVTPVYLALQSANGDAFAAHRPLPHIVTVSTFLFVFPGGAGATLPLVLHLVFSRASRLRKVALAALVPSIFNVNEPLMFGLPIVFNPILGIPYIVVPTLLAMTTYIAMANGWVAKPAFYIPSTVPTVISVFLATADWRAVVLATVNIAIGYLVYWPFVRVYERGVR